MLSWTSRGGAGGSRGEARSGRLRWAGSSVRPGRSRPRDGSAARRGHEAMPWPDWRRSRTLPASSRPSSGDRAPAGRARSSRPTGRTPSSPRPAVAGPGLARRPGRRSVRTPTATRIAARAATSSTRVRRPRESPSASAEAVRPGERGGSGEQRRLHQQHPAVAGRPELAYRVELRHGAGHACDGEQADGGARDRAEADDGRPSARRGNPPEHGEQRHGAARPNGRPGEVQQIGDRGDRQRLIGVERVPGHGGTDEDDRRRERRDGAQPPVERHQGGGGRPDPGGHRGHGDRPVEPRARRACRVGEGVGAAEREQEEGEEQAGFPAHEVRFEPERPEDETVEAGAARGAERAEQEQRAHDDPLPRDGAAHRQGGDRRGAARADREHDQALLLVPVVRHDAPARGVVASPEAGAERDHEPVTRADPRPAGRDAATPGVDRGDARGGADRPVEGDGHGGGCPREPRPVGRRAAERDGVGGCLLRGNERDCRDEGEPADHGRARLSLPPPLLALPARCRSTSTSARTGTCSRFSTA